MFDGISPNIISRMERGGRNSSDSSGINCDFFRIDDTIGLKIYGNKWQAEETYRRQMFAWEHGLAPELKSCVLSFTVRNYLHYGYYTELADIVGELIIAAYFPDIAHIHRSQWRWNKYHQLCNIINKELKYTQHYNQLLRKLDHIGLDTSDMHGFNVGYLNNELVAIDFMGCEDGSECSDEIDDYPLCLDSRLD